MASMYSDPKWSKNIDKAIITMLLGKTMVEKGVAWLLVKAQRKDFSLTDVWGVLTSFGIMKQWDTRKLSAEATRDATNPYPIYNAIEKYCVNNGPTTGKWFEMSPHEEGFTDLGLFVETSLLGSKFEGGALIEKEPELDIIHLQGVTGSAMADKPIKNILPCCRKVAEPDQQKSAEEKEYLQHYNSITRFLTLTKQHITNSKAMAHINDLMKRLKVKTEEHMAKMAKMVKEKSESIFQKFKHWVTELWTTVEDWAHALMDSSFRKAISDLVSKIMPLIFHWKWGTTQNFLYKYKEVPIPEHLQSDRSIHLIDAGLFINVPYAPFLGEKRDMDLIIVQEYSAGEIFETLTLARHYADDVNKPFPELDDKVLEAERDWPKACYVFDGKDKAPTIVFMPLFNQQNCKDAEERKEMMKLYGTFRMNYTEEMVAYLLNVAASNISNNKATLLEEIKKAIQRRKKKMGK